MKKKKISSKVRLNNFDPTVGFSRGAGMGKETCWYLVKVIFFLSAWPYPSSFKKALLKLFGATIGKGFVIKPRVNIHFPWKLEIGDHVWLGEEVNILNFENTSIGNNVCISQRAFLCGGNHDFRTPSMSYRNGPIAIQDGCWIGAACFVGPGVTMGIDSVISAGSVITSDTDQNSIYKGNPAVFVNHRWKDSIKSEDILLNL